MKKNTLILLLLITSYNIYSQNIGINSTGALPDNSAILDLSSTNKGFLITRADTLNIPSPAFGLMTLSPSDSCLYLFNGIKWMGMGGGGSSCSCNCAPPSTPDPFYCGPDITTIVSDVLNPITGKTWMDRNLGASQVANSSTDVAAYGDLYQWGRCSDGHEKRTSGGTSTLSSTDSPGHSDFIDALVSDWRNPPNNNLWQGVSGINNPCPSGYRLPTDVELDAERLSWTTNDAAGALNSPLKLTLAGWRTSISFIDDEGSSAYYWSSTINGTFSNYLNIEVGSSGMGMGARYTGRSVRCIKN